MKALVFTLMMLPVAAAAHTGPELTLSSLSGERLATLALAQPVLQPAVAVCDLPSKTSDTGTQLVACVGQ